MKTVRILLCVLLVTLTAAAQVTTPKDGYVPDAETAIRIATAILIPINRKHGVETSSFSATLNGDVWSVHVDPCPTTACMGGGTEVQISKKDARIIDVRVYK
jgi:hypothetical protein